MANYKEIEDIYSQIKSSNDEINSMKEVKEKITESTDKNGNIVIKLDRTGDKFIVGANPLSAIINANLQQAENEYNQLLKKITIK